MYALNSYFKNIIHYSSAKAVWIEILREHWWISSIVDFYEYILLGIIWTNIQTITLLATANIYSKMWYDCQWDNCSSKSQSTKANLYRSKYGLKHGAYAHTEQKAIKGPKWILKNINELLIYERALWIITPKQVLFTFCIKHVAVIYYERILLKTH